MEPVVVQLKKTSNNNWFKARIAEIHTHDVKSLAVDSKDRIYSGGKHATPVVCLTLLFFHYICAQNNIVRNTH